MISAVVVIGAVLSPTCARESTEKGRAAAESRVREAAVRRHCVGGAQGVES